MTTWFTADYHLGHGNIITYCKRPFDDAWDMNTTIIENLTTAIEPGDTLYHLGDIAFDVNLVKAFIAATASISVVFIKGNHDKHASRLLVDAMIPVLDLADINVNGQKMTLCHYAMRVWNESHFNAWQLHGHSHGTLQPIGKQWDVGVDNNDFKPVSFERLASIMRKQPDNPNYIPPEQRK